MTAPQITVTSGAQIASTTVGSGAGGVVAVTTPGVLALDGMGLSTTQIAASATGAENKILLFAHFPPTCSRRRLNELQPYLIDILSQCLGVVVGPQSEDRLVN